MPYRSDCQIWRRTAERPVESCYLLYQARAEQFQPLVTFGNGPVEIQCVQRLSADSQSRTLVHTSGE